MRPKKDRIVKSRPVAKQFKPADFPANRKKPMEIHLDMDEWEALRLKHSEGLDQIASAKKMGVSQSTFQRILMQAHIKVTDMLVKGSLLKIGGGTFKMAKKSK
jgi:predicted DNA-binding protein (UPF0251 family)